MFLFLLFPTKWEHGKKAIGQLGKKALTKASATPCNLGILTVRAVRLKQTKTLLFELPSSCRPTTT